MNYCLIGFLSGTEERTRLVKNSWPVIHFPHPSPPTLCQKLLNLEHLVIRAKEILRFLSHPRTRGSAGFNTRWNEHAEPVTPLARGLTASPSSPPSPRAGLRATLAEVILRRCDICGLWPPTEESELHYPTFYRLQNKSWPACMACIHHSNQGS